MGHGDQMYYVQVVVGSADCRWLQVNGLLLVQRGHRQHQRHLKNKIQPIFSSIRLKISENGFTPLKKIYSTLHTKDTEEVLLIKKKTYIQVGLSDIGKDIYISIDFRNS